MAHEENANEERANLSYCSPVVLCRKQNGKPDESPEENNNTLQKMNEEE